MFWKGRQDFCGRAPCNRRADTRRTDAQTQWRALVVFPVARRSLPDRAAMTMENTYDDGPALSRNAPAINVIPLKHRGTLLRLSTVGNRIPRTRLIRAL